MIDESNNTDNFRLIKFKKCAFEIIDIQSMYQIEIEHKNLFLCTNVLLFFVHYLYCQPGNVLAHLTCVWPAPDLTHAVKKINKSGQRPTLTPIKSYIFISVFHLQYRQYFFYVFLWCALERTTYCYCIGTSSCKLHQLPLST